MTAPVISEIEGMWLTDDTYQQVMENLDLFRNLHEIKLCDSCEQQPISETALKRVKTINPVVLIKPNGMFIAPNSLGRAASLEWEQTPEGYVLRRAAL
jgi:hypothetical protein